MFLGHAVDVFGWCLMNKYQYLTYLMSKLINIYTLFLTIVVEHVSCSLRIYVISYKIVQPFFGIIEGYSLWINSYSNNYGICMECYIAMAWSKGGCSDMKEIVREFFNATRGVRTVLLLTGRWAKVWGPNGTLKPSRFCC